MGRLGNETEREYQTRPRTYKHRKTGEIVTTRLFRKDVILFEHEDGSPDMLSKREFYKRYVMVDAGKSQ